MLKVYGWDAHFESAMAELETSKLVPGRVIEEQRVDAGDEGASTAARPNAVLAPQMALDDLVRDGDERGVWTLATLDLGLPADAAQPFVGTGRRVA